MSKNNFINKASALLPTKYGTFRMTIYRSIINNCEHIALFMGDIKKQPPVTRVHSQCLTGDTFFSLKCDCGEQLKKSMRIIGKKGVGIIIYLRQEGRGIGLFHKISAYKLQDEGLDTVEANLALGLPVDARDYAPAAEILRDLGTPEIIILTNNPDKIRQLIKNGIRIKKRVPLEIKPNKHNRKYLLAKKQKLGHNLTRL